MCYDCLARKLVGSARSLLEIAVIFASSVTKLIITKGLYGVAGLFGGTAYKMAAYNDSLWAE